MKEKTKANLFETATMIFILIISGILVFKEKLRDLDEIWQYSFAKNILSGLVPYRDFNMITTPLFSFLGAIILKIVANELIIMRVYNFIIFSSILITCYRIFKLLNVNLSISALLTFIMYLLFKYDLEIEYNYLILLIVLLSLYIELYRTNKYGIFDCKNEIFLGALMGLTIITKHTIGILLTVMYCLYKIIFVNNKKELKEFFKISILRIIGAVIPVIILLMYLILNNALRDFINYTILGITEFKNKYLYFNLFFNKNRLIRIFAFIVPISFLSIFYFISFKKQRTKELIILIYSIITFVGNFPIANSGHFIIYAFPGIIYTLYVMYRVLLKIINKKRLKKFLCEFVKSFVLLFMIFYSIKNIKNIVEIYKKSDLNFDIKYFNGIIINDNLKNNIKTIDEYIINNSAKTYILDATASLYMIPIDKYNKDYDMFNKGNFGINGEDRLISEISISENTQFLILKDEYEKNWQTPEKIIEFVKKNKNKVGEIKVYDIYE